MSSDKTGLIITGFYIPYNPKLKDRSRELRKNMTATEQKLWLGFLKYIPQKILRQKPLNNYIVDFYCAQSKLVIEIDGDSHYSYEGKAYDIERTSVLNGYGLKVLRFTNTEVLKNFNAVCEKIGMYLK